MDPQIHELLRARGRKPPKRTDWMESSWLMTALLMFLLCAVLVMGAWLLTALRLGEI